MPNRLATQDSPYLQQHKNNPVDWYPWGEEAFAKAKSENKAIFISNSEGMGFKDLSKIIAKKVKEHDPKLFQSIILNPL